MRGRSERGIGGSCRLEGFEGDRRAIDVPNRIGENDKTFTSTRKVECPIQTAAGNCLSH